jgi:hypothetical protein
VGVSVRRSTRTGYLCQLTLEAGAWHSSSAQCDLMSKHCNLLLWIFGETSDRKSQKYQLASSFRLAFFFFFACNNSRTAEECWNEPWWLSRHSEKATDRTVRCSNRGRGKRILAETSRAVLVPTQPTIKLVPGRVRGVNRSPPSSSEVMNEWSYTSAPPISLHGVDRGNFNVLPLLYIGSIYCNGRYLVDCLFILQFCYNQVRM